MSTETKNHTPGPWIATAGYVRDDFGEIVLIATNDNCSEDEACANALLAAAAPDLLGACRTLVACGSHKALEQARAAIAKATGGQS